MWSICQAGSVCGSNVRIIYAHWNSPYRTIHTKGGPLEFYNMIVDLCICPYTTATVDNYNNDIMWLCSHEHIIQNYVLTLVMPFASHELFFMLIWLHNGFG